MSDNENRKDDLDRVIEISKQTAFNIQSMNEQMGIIATEVKAMKTENRQMKVDIQNVNDDLQQYKLYNEENQYLLPEAREELEQAIKSRVAFLLNEIGMDEDGFNRYFGKFTRKCWVDAKNKRLVVGKKGFYTPRRNHQPAINFINGWTPYKYGVQGYIEYIDRRANA